MCLQQITLSNPNFKTQFLASLVSDIYLGNKECMPTLEVQVTDKGCAK